MTAPTSFCRNADVTCRPSIAAAANDHATSTVGCALRALNRRSTCVHADPASTPTALAAHAISAASPRLSHAGRVFTNAPAMRIGSNGSAHRSSPSAATPMMAMAVYRSLIPAGVCVPCSRRIVNTQRSARESYIRGNAVSPIARSRASSAPVVASDVAGTGDMSSTDGVTDGLARSDVAAGLLQHRFRQHPCRRDAASRGQGDARAHDQTQIDDERHVAHVQKVVMDPLMEVSGVALRAADLPHAADARAHREPGLAPGNADLVLSERRRARADEAHLADDDVEQLRQLVEADAAQPGADTRDPRIALDLELRPIDLVRRQHVALLGVRADDHRAELPAPERPSADGLA